MLSGQVDAAEVLSFADGVRGDMGCLKGIYIALAGFTEEAHVGIRSCSAPIDLIDGPLLLDLVRDHLPDRAPTLEGYRGFNRTGPRHARGNTEASDK